MTIVRNWIVPQIEPRTGTTNFPLITTQSLPNALQGLAYSFAMSAAGGVPPYTWSLVSATPDTGNWLTIDPVSGTLSGIPNAAETEAVLIRVTDSVSAPTAPTAFSLIVNPSTAQTWFGATLPTPPTQFSTVSSPPAPANTNRGSYYTPGVGADAALTPQAAINAAAAATGTSGDVIVLQAGTTYPSASSLTLAARAGQGWIYIISSAAPEIGGSGLPAAGVRVNRSHIPSMPALRCTAAGTSIVSRAGTGVFNYRLVGLDIEATDAQGSASQFSVVRMNASDTTVATLCKNITFDRCYVAGAPVNGSVTGINLEGINMEATECRIERCYQLHNADSHAISWTNSIGPYKVHNNFLSASGETTMPGGGDTTLPSPNMPSDFTITNNHYYKSFLTGIASFTAGSSTMTVLSINGEITPVLQVTAVGPGFTANAFIVQQLTGTPGGVGTYQLTLNAVTTAVSVPVTIFSGLDKNMIEMKVGSRALIDSNYFENAGSFGQARAALVLTSRNQNGGNPWYGIFDFTITNNVFTNCFNGGMQWLLQDAFNTSTGGQNTQPAARHLLRNNLFILSTPGNPNSTTNTAGGFIASNGPAGPSQGQGGHLVWDHNTIAAPTTPNGMNCLFFMGTSTTSNMQLNNIVWSNNIWDSSQFGINKAGSPGGGYGHAVPPQVTQPAFTNNVCTNLSDATIPTGNFFPANAAAVGYTNYGSTTAIDGYALTAGSTFHAKGVSGLGVPFNGTGPVDGTDIGCAVASLKVLRITTTSLPNAKAGVAYAGVTLAATGGTAPYTWALTNAFPNFNNVWGTPGSAIAGGIFGAGVVPQRPESETVIITVTDSVGETNTVVYTFTVAPVTPIFNFANFSGSPAITTGFSATMGPTNLNLIPLGSGHANGSAYFNTQQNISSGFSTTFTFQFTPAMTVPTTAGFTFCVQNTNSTDNPPSNSGLFFCNDANNCGYGSFAVNNTPAFNTIGIKIDANSFQESGYALSGSPNTTGLYVNGGYPGSFLGPANDMAPYGTNLYNGNVFRADVSYDGSLLTWLITDTVTGTQCRQQAACNIPNSTGSSTNWVGFTAGTVTSNTAIEVLSWQFSLAPNGHLATPTFSPAPGQYAGTQTVTISSEPGTTIYYTTNGLIPTAAATKYTGPVTVSANTIIQAVAIGTTGAWDSLIGSAAYQIGTSLSINHASGFAAGDGMVINGSAFRSGTAIQLVDTNTRGNETGSAFWGLPLNVTSFNTSFTLTFAGGTQANGLTFCLQNPGAAYSTSQHKVPQAPAGPNIIGYSQSGMGYGPDESPTGADSTTRGIPNSIAIALDLFHVPNSVGLYTGGVTPTGAQIAMTGITLSSGHPMNVTVGYNGNTLTFSITDSVTTTNFATSFIVNIPALVGGNTAYAGFTAGTGGQWQNMSVTAWTW